MVLEAGAFVEADLTEVRCDTGLMAARRAIAGTMRVEERKSVLILCFNSS